MPLSRKQEVLLAVREGCRTAAEVSKATEIDVRYCANLLRQFELEGTISSRPYTYGVKYYYCPLSTRAEKKRQEELSRPVVRDPLVAALFGEAVHATLGT